MQSLLTKLTEQMKEKYLRGGQDPFGQMTSRPTSAVPFEEISTSENFNFVFAAEKDNLSPPSQNFESQIDYQKATSDLQRRQQQRREKPSRHPNDVVGLRSKTLQQVSRHRNPISKFELEKLFSNKQMKTPEKLDRSQTKKSPTRTSTTSPRRRAATSPGRRLPVSPNRKPSTSPSRRTSPLKTITTSPNKKVATSPIRKLTSSPSRRMPSSPNRRIPTSPSGKPSSSPIRRMPTTSVVRNLLTSPNKKVEKVGTSKSLHASSAHDLGRSKKGNGPQLF